MSVTKLPYQFDADELLSIYETVDNQHYQSYITSLDGQTYAYDYDFIKEQISLKNFHLLNEMTVMNKFFVDSYVEEVYNTIAADFNVSRARFMTLDKDKRGYSYHKDASKRLHIPLVTNEDNILLVDDVVYRLDVPGALYEVDTTKKHTALNLGWEDRVHIVFDLKLDLDNVRYSKTFTH